MNDAYKTQHHTNPLNTVLVFRNKNGKRIAIPLGASNVCIIEEQTTANRKKVERPYCSIFLNNPSHLNNHRHVDHTLDEVRKAWESATGVKWIEVLQPEEGDTDYIRPEDEDK